MYHNAIPGKNVYGLYCILAPASNKCIIIYIT
jgi:hypothetical protein